MLNYHINDAYQYPINQHSNLNAKNNSPKTISRHDINVILNDVNSNLYVSDNSANTRQHRRVLDETPLKINKSPRPISEYNRFRRMPILKTNPMLTPMVRRHSYSHQQSQRFPNILSMSANGQSSKDEEEIIKYTVPISVISRHRGVSDLNNNMYFAKPLNLIEPKFKRNNILSIMGPDDFHCDDNALSLNKFNDSVDKKNEVTHLKNANITNGNAEKMEPNESICLSRSEGTDISGMYQYNNQRRTDRLDFQNPLKSYNFIQNPLKSYTKSFYYSGFDRKIEDSLNHMDPSLFSNTADAETLRETKLKYPSLQSVNHINNEQSLYNMTHGTAYRNYVREPTSVQRIFCVRHGERVDSAFGGDWTIRSFNYKGLYLKNNLNLPTKIPNRQNPVQSFKGDCPLTEIGSFQARLTGQALRSQAIKIDCCYSSPALRCIQTADCILKGLGLDKAISIRIEPGLFEFLRWYERAGIPNFLTPEDLLEMGYNIDLTYLPCIKSNQLNPKENHLDFYNRNYRTVLYALDNQSPLNIMICGHAATLEVCTRQLCGHQPRSYQDFNAVIRRVSYLGLNMCEKKSIKDTWKLKEPPIPPMQHTSNLGFDWKTLL